MATFTASRRHRQRLCTLLAEGETLAADWQDTPLVEAAMLEGVDLLLLPESIDGDMTGIRQRRKEFAIWHLRLSHAMQQILSAVARSGCPVIALRGRSLAETLYADPVTRPQSDIDLLMRPNETLAVKQALWDLGFRPSAAYPNIFVRGDLMLDTHTEPLGIERIRAWEHLTSLRAEDFFRHSRPGELSGKPALLVEPRVLLPYLCFHALKHSFERLIWLVDIALLARQVEAADGWDEVLAGIREYRLERPCYYALAYAKQHLAAPVPETLLTEIRPAMGFVERNLFARHMAHAQIPFLAERLFARMQPDFRHRLAFWRETIYPRYEVRRQMANGGCVKCSFIRKRLKQLLKATWLLLREAGGLLLPRLH